MKLTCALCGRPTEPAAMIGNMAIGPKCAQKAGLLKPRKGSKIVIFKRVKEEGPQTMDLFDDLGKTPIGFD